MSDEVKDSGKADIENHGTLESYLDDGCRCKACNNAYQRERYRLKREYKLKKEPPNRPTTRAEQSCGAPSPIRFKNGCRCEDCCYIARTYKERMKRRERR